MSPKNADQYCPDCARPLQNVGDYPSNELWCLHCGNRYFASVTASEGECSDPLLGFRILLLDDRSDRRDHLVRHFTRLGYQVTPVCHARQALEAVSFRRFDVAVMPFKLSEFNCLDLICKLQRRLAGVKFVVLSEGSGPLASDLETSDVVCVQADTSDFERLEQIVEQLIDEAVACAQGPGTRKESALVASS